jgi:UDP-N-acetylmuramate--alanine ligase
VNKVPFYGAAVLCLDEPAVQSLIPQIKRRTITYGTAAQADVSISDVVMEGLTSTFNVRFNGGSTQQDPA